MQKIEIPENWAVYIGRVEDKPAMFRVNLGLGEIDLPLPQFTYCVQVSVPLKNPDQNGFSFDKERNVLYNIEDTLLIPKLKETDLLAAVFSFEGSITWYFYSQDAATLVPLLEEAFNTTDYTAEVEVVTDPEWKTYSEFLYPNIYEYQSIKNSEVQRHCEESGDHTDQQRPIEHWLYFDTEKDMNNALSKVIALGYKVEDSGRVEPEEGDTSQEAYYHLILSKVNTIDDINGDTWDLIDVALDTNGQYDGWETVLVK
ncbi:DUF695 domain-containing protein [Capnocytophaga leadbetteri]|uniref:DUF695 domain-containing protein n=1 Tax=Capnocytophaga leadbetteri TaxID=327575 RepID=UPI0028E79168|nr:DUF695 domain-containing protein [Capnocytophaga leadbetteri]